MSKYNRKKAMIAQAEYIARYLGCADLETLLHQKDCNDRRVHRNEQAMLYILLLALDYEDFEIKELFHKHCFYNSRKALNNLFTHALTIYRETYYKHLFQAIHDAVQRRDDECTEAADAAPRPVAEGDKDPMGVAPEEHEASGLLRPGARPQQHAAKPADHAAAHHQHQGRSAAARR